MKTMFMEEVTWAEPEYDLINAVSLGQQGAGPNGGGHKQREQLGRYMANSTSNAQLLNKAMI